MQLNDLAVNTGRALQSPETGFVHLFKGKVEPPHQAIPFFENLLFALALCRTKTAEGVQEGKGIVEKLLAYQHANGLFPIYLHEFPFCYDRYIGAHLLPGFYWLYHCFHTVLGADLAKKLQYSMTKLLEVSLQEVSAMPLPYQVKVGGVASALGRQFDKSEWIEKGEELLAEVEGLWNSSSSLIPTDLADCLTGLILGHSAKLEKLMQWMGDRWNPLLQSYVGPFQQMNFTQGNQEITLYDLYMGLFQGTLTPRAKVDPVLLQGALCFPMAEKQILFSQKEPWSAAWHSGAVDISQKGFYPFSFQWGLPELVQMLFFQAANATDFSLVQEGNGYRMHAQLGALPNLEMKESQRELIWFLSLLPEVRILVNGLPSTTFRENDLVSIEDTKMRLELTFNASQGIFQGHISKGCAPSERTNFGHNRFAAYQWQIFWRTIERQMPCSIAMHLRYLPKNQ